MPGILHEVQHICVICAGRVIPRWFKLKFPVKTREFKTYSPKRGGGAHPMPVSPRGVMPWGYGREFGRKPGACGRKHWRATANVDLKDILILDVLGLNNKKMPLELSLLVIWSSGAFFTALKSHVAPKLLPNWSGSQRMGLMAEMTLGDVFTVLLGIKYDVMHVTCRVIQSHVLQNGLILMFDWCQVERTSSNH